MRVPVGTQFALRRWKRRIVGVPELHRAVRAGVLKPPAGEQPVPDRPLPFTLARHLPADRVPGRAREMSGFSSRGQPRYTTRERIVVENRGTAAAEDFTVDFELPPGEAGDLPHILASDAPVARFQAGASFEIPVHRAFGTASRIDVVFRWREGERSFEDRQTVL